MLSVGGSDKFTTDVSADAMESYLDRAAPFDHIDLLLFQHGVRSAGLVPIERWRALLRRARKSARFVALRPERHPSSTSTYIYYSDSLRRSAEQFELPPPLSVAELDEFLASGPAHYPVEWIHGGRLPERATAAAATG